MTTLDYNGDGWTDIYVAVDSQASILFHNNGDETFEDVGIFAGVSFDDNSKVQAGMGLGGWGNQFITITEGEGITETRAVAGGTK